MELTGVAQISHFNKWLASPRKQFWLLLHDSEFSKSGCWGMYALRALNVVEHALHIVSVTSKYVWKLLHRANLPGREIHLGSVISFNQSISLFIRRGNELQVTPTSLLFSFVSQSV